MPNHYRTHAALRRQMDRQYVRYMFRELASLMRQLNRMHRYNDKRGALIKRARRLQDSLAAFGAMPVRG